MSTAIQSHLRTKEAFKEDIQLIEVKGFDGISIATGGESRSLRCGGGMTGDNDDGNFAPVFALAYATRGGGRSRRGRLPSINTRSGQSVSAARTASSPSTASVPPIPRISKIVRSMKRVSSWSSTMRTSGAAEASDPCAKRAPDERALLVYENFIIESACGAKRNERVRTSLVGGGFNR